MSRIRISRLDLAYIPYLSLLSIPIRGHTNRSTDTNRSWVTVEAPFL